MKWNYLTDESQLEAIRELSKSIPQVIFKHSTRCSISSMAKSRLERSIEPEHIQFHFLDLIAHRSLSSRIAEEFNVYHESPQVLVIINGECTYDESHSGISMDMIEEQARFPK